MNKNIKKLQKIIDKLYNETNNKQDTQIITLNTDKNKLDVLYEDIFKIKGYFILKNSVKTTYDFLQKLERFSRSHEQLTYNSLNFEKNFISNSALKFDYYESTWAFTKLPILTNNRQSQTQQLKNTLKTYVYSLKDDIKTNIEEKIKNKYCKPQLGSIVNKEFKNHDTKLKIYQKNPDIIKNKPIVKVGKLSPNFELNIKIFCHPAIEWSNWRIVQKNVESVKIPRITYNNALFFNENNIDAQNFDNTAQNLNENICCTNPIKINKCLWLKKGKDQTLKFSFKDCKETIELFQSKNCGKLLEKKNIIIDNDIKIISVSTLNNSSNITLYINSSIDPCRPIELETESTDQDPYKIRLKTNIEIPTIIVEDIIAEGGEETEICQNTESHCGDSPWKLSNKNPWMKPNCANT